MKEQLLQHDRPVPRYTSYPTAPHFHAGIGPVDYARWLRTLAEGTALSLYLHVPFCRRLCWFCGCHMAVVNDDNPVRRYADALRQEARLVASEAGEGRPLAHLHFGGGSPTILPPDEFTSLLVELRRRFAFEAETEVAVEVDPRTLNDGLLDAFAANGVNRASLGVQDVNPEVQRAINRIQPVETTARCVDGLRSRGIGRINIDMMYGLPHQSLACVERTVDSVVDLAPDRVALFGYAHVPWMKKHQGLIPEKALPGPAARLEAATAAGERLAAHGYVAIGLDHFARPHDPLAIAAREGRLRRNFQGYTDDAGEALIGLGASAIGTLPRGYVQNLTATRDYLVAIREGRLAISRGLALTSEDILRRAVIERLMCDLKVDLAEIGQRYRVSTATFGPAIGALEPLRRDGLVRITDAGSHIEVPDAARPAVRLVCAAFDGFLDQSAGRHSASV